MEQEENKIIVRRLKRWEIGEIAKNYKLTGHGYWRIKQRSTIPPKREKMFWLIKHSKFAFQDTDGAFIVEIDKEISFVFKYDEKKQKFMLLTCLGYSHHDYSVEGKYKVAKRKENKNEHIDY